jgi:hypothetical protein
MNLQSENINPNLFKGMAETYGVDTLQKSKVSNVVEIKKLKESNNTIQKSPFSEKFDELDDIFKSLSGENEDKDYLEKAGKRASIGEVRTYGSKKYVKHADGWVYIAKDGSAIVYAGKIAATHAFVGDDSHKAHASKYLDKEKTEDVKPEVKKESVSTKETSTPVVEKVKERIIFPTSTKDLKTIKTLGGSSDVKLKKDDDGNYWAIKPERASKEDSAQHLRYEKLTDSIYTAFGFNAPISKIIKTADGKVEKVSKYIQGAKELGSISESSKKEVYNEIKKGFVLDCLLGNWDVIGASKDNIIVDKDGLIHRVDNGGSLIYRARGGKKPESDFGKEVKELKTFIDGTNPITKEIFGDISNKEIVDQIDEIVKNKEKIITAIRDSDIASPSETYTLETKLQSRIEYLSKKRSDYIKLEKTEEEKPEAKKEEEFDSSKYSSRTTQLYAEKFSKLEIEGNVGFKDAILKQILKIEKDKKSNYESFATKRGISVEEYKGLLQKHVEKLMSESEYFRATDIEILDKILTDHGRYKSQFEVGSSHGSYYPEGRSRAENKFFGFKDDIKHDVEKRPIYGYCSSNNNGVNNSKGEIPPASNASMYGQVTVKIKKDIALKKATVTFEDSLGSLDSMASTPAVMPHFTSLNISTSNDPLDTKNTCERSSYTEIQYHNQLSFDDIESVHMSAGFEGSRSGDILFKNINKMIEIGRKTNAPIVIFGKK